MKSRVAFVTCDEWRELDRDDLPAVEALNKRGHIVDAVIWDDPSIEWSNYDLVVLRSTWDYYVKHEAFSKWIDTLDEHRINVWNPPATLRWNLDKIYLRELSSKGIPITPTVFAESGDSLSRIVEQNQWTDVVIKPRISAAGHRTIRTKAGHADDHQAEMDELIRLGGVLVQKYLPVIESEGEWSFMFIDGRYSHAARKRSAGGEFRVQSQFGGTTSPGSPSPDLIAQAQRVVDAVPRQWLYARVDGCVVDGQLLLMELEMLEPSLFFLQDPGSADRFADAIESRLTRFSSRGT